jgi:hypothetical protein
MGEDININFPIMPEWCSRDFGAQFISFPSWVFGPFDFSGSRRTQHAIDHDLTVPEDTVLTEQRRRKDRRKNRFEYKFENPMTSCWYLVFLDPGDGSSIGPREKAHLLSSDKFDGCTSEFRAWF